jgi:hypothetical protein
MTVECPMKDCKNNIMNECNKDKICLKWRFAADMGKGNIVCMECLDMELMGDK